VPCFHSQTSLASYHKPSSNPKPCNPYTKMPQTRNLEFYNPLQTCCRPEILNPEPQPQNQTIPPGPRGGRDPHRPCCRETEFCVDILLVRDHFTVAMIRWTGLAPWEFEFPFPGSRTSTFLDHESHGALGVGLEFNTSDVWNSILMICPPSLFNLSPGQSKEVPATVKYSSQFQNNYITEMCSSSEVGS